jgi:hypothetical protein
MHFETLWAEADGPPVAITPFALIDLDSLRPKAHARDADMFIAGALIRDTPVGPRFAWISILNMEAAPLSLDGWFLEDHHRVQAPLGGIVGPGMAMVLRERVIGALRPGPGAGLLRLMESGAPMRERHCARYRMDAVTPGRALVFPFEAPPSSDPLGDPRGY